MNGGGGFPDTHCPLVHPQEPGPQIPMSKEQFLWPLVIAAQGAWALQKGLISISNFAVKGNTDCELDRI